MYSPDMKTSERCSPASHPPYPPRYLLHSMSHPTLTIFTSTFCPTHPQLFTPHGISLTLEIEGKWWAPEEKLRGTHGKNDTGCFPCINVSPQTLSQSRTLRNNHQTPGSFLCHMLCSKILTESRTKGMSNLALFYWFPVAEASRYCSLWELSALPAILLSIFFVPTWLRPFPYHTTVSNMPKRLPSRKLVLPGTIQLLLDSVAT